MIVSPVQPGSIVAMSVPASSRHHAPSATVARSPVSISSPRQIPAAKGKRGVLIGAVWSVPVTSSQVAVVARVNVHNGSR
jgi:hypothetical protein